jgi:hypothetical protein
MIGPGDRLALGDCALHVLTEQAGRATLVLRCGATAVYFLQALDDDSAAALELQPLPPATLVVYPWSRAPDTALLHLLHPAAIVFSEDDAATTQRSWAERHVGTARLYHEALHGQIELRGDGDHATIAVERGD